MMRTSEKRASQSKPTTIDSAYHLHMSTEKENTKLQNLFDNNKYLIPTFDKSAYLLKSSSILAKLSV